MPTAVDADSATAVGMSRGEPGRPAPRAGTEKEGEGTEHGGALPCSVPSPSRAGQAGRTTLWIEDSPS